MLRRILLHHIWSHPIFKDTPLTHLGLLAPLLDPIGNALGTGLRPIGVGVETITKPLTNAVGGITKPVLGPIVGSKDEKMEVLGGNNKDSYEHTKESIGGKLQTGDNPLGLDQTGRWGFREGESSK